MKKILYITYYWPPSGGAGVQRSLKFVKYLREFNIDPIVLTVDPEKASYPLIDDSLIKEISSMQKVFRTDSFEPLKVFSGLSGKDKVPFGGFANSKKEGFIQKTFRFIRGNFFIPDARRGWVKFAVRKASEIIREENIGTIVISSPPHSSQLIGLKLKRLFPECKWIADLRDPWTDIYYYQDLKHTEIARKLDEKYEREVLENCDAAIVVSADIKRLFSKKSDKIKDDKFIVIPNGFDTDDFDAGVQPEKECFLITYVGTIADNYNPEVFFIAFNKLTLSNPTVKIKLRFVGSVSTQIVELIGKYCRPEQVELISHVVHREAIHYMQTASLLLLLIPAVKNDKGILTGKLFEYIGSGRPIVGIGNPQGDAGTILCETNSGKMFGRDESLVLENYLSESLRQWQRDTRFGYQSPDTSPYSRKKLSEKLSHVILNC